MNTATRIFVTLGMGLGFAVGCQTRLDDLVPGGDPVTSEQEPQDGQGNPGQDQDSDPATPTQPQDQPAEQFQRMLGGQRLTYLTSNSNGDVYTSYREDLDLCSSGEFQTRIVSQTSGYGTANEDVYEGVGAWRIVADGEQLMLELDLQQTSNGYSGTDQYPIELRPGGELYFNNVRFSVTPDSPVCN